MNKRSYTLVGVLLLAIVGAGVFVYARSDQATDKQPDTYAGAREDTSNSAAGSSEQAAKGQYLAYSEELVASTKGTKLLFFHAPWCPQCRELDASIQASSIPADTTIFKVDYDSNQALRQKYEVTIQTTVVKIDDQGNKIASYVAYDEPTFATIKNELLP